MNYHKFIVLNVQKEYGLPHNYIEPLRVSRNLKSIEDKPENHLRQWEMCKYNGNEDTRVKSRYQEQPQTKLKLYSDNEEGSNGTNLARDSLYRGDWRQSN